MAVPVRKLVSAGSRIWAVLKLIDLKSVLLGGKVINGTQVIEIGIPKSMGSLVLRTSLRISSPY